MLCALKGTVEFAMQTTNGTEKQVRHWEQQSGFTKSKTASALFANEL